jgi:predicted phosphodiesterase
MEAKVKKALTLLSKNDRLEGMNLQPILFVPDCHRPYHDKRAYKLMMQVAEDLQPEIVVVMGDYADCFSISAHSKNPERAGKFMQEVKDIRSGIRELEGLGAERLIFCEGNHCDRLRRYIEDKAPELFGITCIPELFELGNWEFIPYRTETKIGKLIVTHDVGHVGRYAAHRTLDAVQHNIVTGHSHHLNYTIEGNTSGEAHVSAQFGWLGDAKAADYMNRVKALRNWALGFGVGYLNPKTGCVYLTPVPIVNYSCVFNGTLYKT